MGAGIVVLFFLVLIVAINPLRNFPVEDDWDYSKQVLNLLQTGAFHRLEVTQATVFFPALWGALFSQLFGYSFATLRVSTLVLALGTLLFFYLLLGELGFDAVRRVLGTLTLMLAPMFVFLAFSFMTDIFLLFGILGALFFYVRAWRTKNMFLAVIASVFAALGFLARQVGIFVPISFALLVVIYEHKHRARAVGWILAGATIPFIVLGIYLVWSRFGGGANWADSARTLTGTVGFWLHPDTPGVFVRRYAEATSTIGIYLLPLWLALLGALVWVRQGWGETNRLQKILFAVLALLSIVALVRAGSRGEWFPYMTDILTRAGMRPYLAFFAEGWGATRPAILPSLLATGLTFLAGLCGIVLSALFVGRLGNKPTPGYAFIYLTTLVLALASLTFFTYFERYLLPLMVGILILVLDATRRARISIPLGAAGVLVAAIVSVALMRDYFSWNELRWRAGNELLESGVPAEQIDGGYEWNGWQLYDASIAHIRANNLEMTIDPWKYILDPQYMFAFQSTDGYRISRTYRFMTPLRGRGIDQFYLLRRQAP